MASADRTTTRRFTMIFGPFEVLFDNFQLFLILLKRDLQSSVRGSALGLAWFIITPLVLVAIYTFVFGVILKSTWFDRSGSPLEVPLIYFCGLIIFSFFMEVVTRSPEYLRANSQYVKKIVFPVALLNWILMGSALLKLLSGFILLCLFLLIVTGGVSANFLYIPLILLPFFLLVTGLAWFITAIGTYVRDINQLLLAVGPIIMFVSPIFYSVDQIPAAFRVVFWMNPLTFVLETVRGLLFFQQPPDWTAYAIYSVAAYLIFLAGFAFFQRARRGFADVL